MAVAREFRVDLLPNGSVLSCANCHVNPAGGGARNPFGLAVQAITGTSSRAFWSPTLAQKDSDGDGFTNGAELGDPDGDGTPVAGAKVTNPGSASSKPQNQAPTVRLTGPEDGAVFTLPAVATVTAEATDADGSVARVEFFDGARSLGVVTQPPFSLLVDWAEGGHTVTARATDNQGAGTTSPPITMTVNAPEPTVLSLAGRAEGVIQLAWSGGGGPFAVQGKGATDDPWCTVGDLTAGRSATSPIPVRAGYSVYRVADLATGETNALSVVLSGAYEQPVAVNGAGHGSRTLTLRGNTLSFDIQYAGLSGTATAAHIHGPAGMEGSAGVLIDLAPFKGSGFGQSGNLAGSVVLQPEQKAAILSGKTYVNVHTAANPGGEIRGQILLATLQAGLGGRNERPQEVGGEGKGAGSFQLRGDQLSFSIAYQGLSGVATAAHIHGPADAENSAGVLIDLAPFNGGSFGASGSLAGTVTLTPAQLAAVGSGLAYVNLHTAAHPGGEIRGQICGQLFQPASP